MLMFLIQSAILILIAFIVGCIIGSLLKLWFGKPKDVELAKVTTQPNSTASAIKAKPTPTKNVQSQRPAAPKPATQKVATGKPSKATASKHPAGDDNLKQVKGIGKQNEIKLKAAGINTFSQIAALTPKAQKELGERLAFPGRMEREDWVKQAKVLAKGGKTEFSNRVSKGEVASSPKAKPAK